MLDAQLSSGFTSDLSTSTSSAMTFSTDPTDIKRSSYTTTRSDLPPYTSSLLIKLIQATRKNFPALRCVILQEGSSSTDISLGNQLNALQSLRQQLNRIPIYFIIPINNQHFIFGAWIEQSLLLVNPKGDVVDATILNEIRRVQSHIGLEKIYLSSTVIQRDPETPSVPVSGVICQELMRHFSEWQPEVFLNALAGLEVDRETKPLSSGEPNILMIDLAASILLPQEVRILITTSATEYQYKTTALYQVQQQSVASIPTSVTDEQLLLAKLLSDKDFIVNFVMHPSFLNLKRSLYSSTTDDEKYRFVSQPLSPSNSSFPASRSGTVFIGMPSFSSSPSWISGTENLPYDEPEMLPMTSAPLPSSLAAGSLTRPSLSEEKETPLPVVPVVTRHAPAKRAVLARGLARVDTMAENSWRTSHFQKALDAIANYDLKALQVELGPNLFAVEERYTQNRYEQRVEWVEGKNSYLLLQTIKKVLRLYERKHQDDVLFSFCEKTLRERGVPEEASQLIGTSWPSLKQYKQLQSDALTQLHTSGIIAYDTAMKPVRTHLTHFATEELRVAIPTPPFHQASPAEAKDIAAAIDTALRAEIQSSLTKLRDEINHDIEQRVASRLSFFDEEGLRAIFLNELLEQHRIYLQGIYDSLFHADGCVTVFEKVYDFMALKNAIHERYLLLTQAYRHYCKGRIDLDKAYQADKKKVISGYKEQSTQWVEVQLNEASYFSEAELKQHGMLDTRGRQIKRPADIAAKYVTEILNSDIGSVSLRRLQDMDGTLFHHAVLAYKKASDDDKEKAIEIIKRVLLHGCHPYYTNMKGETAFTFANRLVPKGEFLPDWRLNETILECTFNIYGQANRRIKEHLLCYCRLTQQRLDSFFGRLRLDTGITEERRVQVAELIATFVESGDIGKESALYSQYRTLASTARRGGLRTSAFANAAQGLVKAKTEGTLVVYDAPLVTQVHSTALRRTEQELIHAKLAHENNQRLANLQQQESEAKFADMQRHAEEERRQKEEEKRQKEEERRQKEEEKRRADESKRSADKSKAENAHLRALLAQHGIDPSVPTAVSSVEEKATLSSNLPASSSATSSSPATTPETANITTRAFEPPIPLDPTSNVTTAASTFTPPSTPQVTQAEQRPPGLEPIGIENQSNKKSIFDSCTIS